LLKKKARNDRVKMTTINMQTIRYINLLDKTSRVRTSKCFIYNNTIIFAVPKSMMSRAIGPNASHIRELQERLGKKIRIISEAEGTEDAQRFIENVVSPIKFKFLEVTPEGVLITSGNTQVKAALFGRNKKRLEELGKIVKDTFGLELRII